MKKDYDKKLFRLIKILNIIQEARKTNTADLATEFNISRRTAQRDISRLITAGFPIMEDELVKGAYHFAGGYSLRGLPVSDAEVSLLVSLCDVAKHMGVEFDQAYKNIFAKVMNTGPWDSPFHVMMPRTPKNTADKGLIKIAEEAIENNRKLRITYNTEEGKKDLVIEPLKLLFYEGYWYLAARPSGVKWIIKNRLDRIEKLESLEEHFKPTKAMDKILREAHSIWFSESRDIEVRIRVSPEAAGHIQERNWFPLQKIVKRNRDGGIVIETTLCHYMEAIPTILRWIPHLTVLSPKELSLQIKKSVAAYLRAL